VAVGADPSRIAILDNFCWGNTDRPETLGSLVRAALACHDVAVALGTPFISGKDSLNNEFRPHDGPSIAIPPSLLISAMGQVRDVSRCVTMDLKEAGNVLFIVGQTHDELGGSHWLMVRGTNGGAVPKLDAAAAKATFFALHHAIDAGLVRACHDLSEGGLATALAEMAFAGGLGATVDIDKMPVASSLGAEALLFSESNTRFLCEVRPDNIAAFKTSLADVPLAEIGSVLNEPSLTITKAAVTLVDAHLATLKAAWLKTLDW
jgi:phosphoribosylformylglycinamidine synthase